MKKVNTFATIKRRYYTIGQVAIALGIMTPTIRFWEKYFNIEPAQRTAKGYRKYTINEYMKICLVYDLLKKEKYTLEGAQQRIKNLGGFRTDMVHYNIMAKETCS